MVKVSELTVGQGNVDVSGVIKEVGEKRAFNRYGRELVVSNAVLEDDSGSIKLTLWNDDVDNFKEGDKIQISNGYVNEFQGEKQLTSGKFGKIEKIGEGEASEKSDEGQTELEGEETETVEKEAGEKEAGEEEAGEEEAGEEEAGEEEADSKDF